MAAFSDYLKTIFFIVLLVQFAPPLVHSLKKQYHALVEPKTKVAYVPIKGIILQSGTYAKTLRSYFKDQSIKGIVIHLESPGGAAGASEALALELDTLKKTYHKPVIVMSENVCASGAYYVAAVADLIFVQASTLVGSIGTSIPYQFKLKDFIEQFHIHYNAITAGEYKGTTDPFINAKPEHTALLQAVAQDSYRTFIDHVTAHRHQVTKDTSNTWANGKIFTGKQAQILGLVDHIGSLSQVTQKMKELALIEGDIQWIKPEKSKGLLSVLTGNTEDVDNSSSSMATILRTLQTLLAQDKGQPTTLYFQA